MSILHRTFRYWNLSNWKRKFLKKHITKKYGKNQKELEDYLLHLKPYINTKDYERIYGYIRIIHNEEDFYTEFKRFCDEANYVSRKFLMLYLLILMMLIWTI